MRRFTTVTALVALAVAAASSTQAAEVLFVPMDHAVRLTTPGSVSNIFVGNPKVADVAVINSNTLVVMGKGQGQTNLVALDASGRTIMTRDINVQAQGEMTLYRGARASAYSCSPNCQASTAESAATAPTGLPAALAPAAGTP